MAGQSITFDFLSRGAASLSRDFRSIGDDSALSSRGVKVLSDVIEKLGSKEDRTAAESVLLAKALRQTGDAADTAAAKAVLADAAVGRLGEQMKASQGKSNELDKALKGLSINPGLAGPAVALIPALGTLTGVVAGLGVGLAGAFVAGAGALAAFGAVAKPVLSSALTAEQAVNTAQNNYSAAIAGGTKQAVAYKAEQIAINKAYAELSPAQIKLSQQLGNMANAWQAVKAAQTPVVAGALQPWLKSVTDLTTKLGPIIAAVSPVIGKLGAQFDALIRSPSFTAFRNFIAGTGSAVVGAAGGTIIDLVKAFIILLPKFNPLILQMTGGIAAIGPAVLKWASSQKTADQITAFMGWFTKNGPVVGGLLMNLGGALKALAPGLTTGGALQLKVISDFLGLVAKLPKDIAKPLAEVAGALLILNKMGVFSVGVKLIGMDAAKAAAAGGAAGIWGKLLPGVRLVGAALVIDVIVEQVLKSIGGGPGKPNPFDNPFGGANPSNPVKGAKPNALSSWDQLGADIANIWNSAWNNVITRTAKGFHDLAGWFNAGRHDIAATWDTIWASASAPVIAQFDKIKSFVTTSFDKWWAANGVALKMIWQSTWGDIKLIFQSLFVAPVTLAVKVVWDAIRGFFSSGSGAVGGTWSGLWKQVSSVFHALWDPVAPIVKTGWALIQAAFNIGVAAVKGVWNVWWAYAQATVKTVWAAIQLIIKTAWDVIVGIFTVAINLLTGRWGAAWNAIKNTGIQVWNAIKAFFTTALSSWTTAFSTAITQVVNFFAALGSRILGALGKLGSLLVSSGQAVIQGLLNGMTSVITQVWTFIQSIPGKILSFLGIKSPPQWAIDAGKHIMNGLGIGMAQAQGALTKGTALFKASAIASAAGIGLGGVSNTSAVAALQSAAAKKGWTGQQWTDLVNVEMREAGFSLTATNPSSGAYGMAQFINGPSEYAQYGGNSTTAAGQAVAMVNYIAQRYGNPAAAWAHELAYGWYDRGGWLMPGLTLAHNTSGRPEQVIPAGHGGGQDPMVAELRALRAEIRKLTGVAAAIPGATGAHVGGAISGAAGAAAMRRRFPNGGW